MKARLIAKSIFVVFLIIILFCLIFIIFDKAGTGAKIYNPIKIVDYSIVENSPDECEEMLELIYSDKKYNYYLPCKKSDNISLVWEEGVTDPLMFAIEHEKVTMDSLMEHGLDIIKNEK